MNKKYFLIAVLALLIAALTWRLLPVGAGQPQRDTIPKGALSQSRTEEAEPPSSTAGTSPTTTGASRQTSPETLADVLANGGDPLWLENLPRLHRLSSMELWNLLDLPQIASQPQAKFLRNRLIGACSSALAQLRSNVPAEQWHNAPVVLEWCKPMLSITEAERMRRLRELNNDPDVLDKLYEVPAPGLMKTDAERQELLEQSITVLDHSVDPYLVRRATDNLMSMDPAHLIEDLATWKNMHPNQQGTISSQLQQLASCEATRSCGPGTLPMIEYCASNAPWVTCQPGMSMHQAVQNAMSPHDYQILTGILNTIRQRRAAVPGP